eukprot:Phypoly_transcript_22255.p1 GENE.Phypoly_transcript_22255~~Phypoly_transcript_22255.p1  ORF type:complete len:182 (+),score=21.04 Phypoly_transcript_22255:20-565(+)
MRCGSMDSRRTSNILKETCRSGRTKSDDAARITQNARTQEHRRKQSTQPSTSNMSVNIWEHQGENSELAEKALTKEFPFCRAPIHESFSCIRALHSQGLHTPAVEDKLCKERKAKAAWCILSSFCPSEAAAFMKCNKNRIPGEKENNVSFFCSNAWQKFDDCLVKITNENEIIESAKATTP